MPVITYEREDFKPVSPLVPDQFFCAGCNASWDDYELRPGPKCPCVTHGDGGGSLSGECVEAYLADAKAR